MAGSVLHGGPDVYVAFEEAASKAAAGAVTPEAYLKGGSIVVRHGGIEHEIDFVLVKGRASSWALRSTKPSRRSA